MHARLRPLVVATSLVAPLTLGAAWAAAAGPGSDATASPTTIATSTTILAVAPTITVAAPSTPSALIAAAFQQTLSSPSRFALYTDIVGTSIDLTGDRPVATGAITPDGIALDVDLAPLFGVLGIEVTDVDTTMQLILSGPGVFVRAPLLGALAGDLGDAAGPLAALDDGWGFVSFEDLASTGDDSDEGSVTPTDVGSILQLLAANPAYLQSAFDSVPITELGTDSIDGVAVTGYELLLPDSDSDAVAPGETPAPTGTPVEVWVGDDGYVHRIALRVDGDTIDSMGSSLDVDLDDLGTVGDVAESAESGVGDLGVAVRIDFSDFGATDVVVAPPSDYVDLTTGTPTNASTKDHDSKG